MFVSFDLFKTLYALYCGTKGVLFIRLLVVFVGDLSLQTMVVVADGVDNILLRGKFEKLASCYMSFCLYMSILFDIND